MSSNKEIYGQKIDFNSSNTRTVLKADSIVDSIVDKFIDRSRVGKKKYGVTLDREDFSLYDWCEHSIQEAMDLILYLKKVQKMIDPKR
jgi:succinate dehydrogenase flavin-adding protein (antitoxin of CptAB toxin-antitoxin module)